MKHKQLIFHIASLALVFLTALPVFAGLPSSCLRIRTSDASAMVIDFSLPPYEIRTVPGPDGRSGQLVVVKGWGRMHDAGAPDLPVFGTLVRVPEGKKPVVTLLESGTALVKDCDVLPVRARQSGLVNNVPETRKDSSIYGRDRFYPEKVVFAGAVRVFRGTRVFRIAIQPFQWNPETRQLRCYTHMAIKIVFARDTTSTSHSTLSIKGRQLRERVDPVFDRVKKAMILNYAPISRTSRLARPLYFNTAGTTESLEVRADAVRIEIKQSGIYRITFSGLEAVGLNLSEINHDNLKMFNAGREVAIQIDEDNGYIEFYAQAIDNRYTGVNVYLLYWTEGAGLRMRTIDARVSGGAGVIDDFTDVAHVEQNTDFWAKTPGAQYIDYWYWSKLSAPQTAQSPHPAQYTVNIPSPESGAGDAVVSVYFQGRTTAAPHPDHHTKIYLNNHLIGNDFWDWSNTHVQEMTIARDLLIDGANTLKIECPGDTGADTDIVYFNWVEIRYQRRLVAKDDELVIHTDETLDRAQMTVTGFGGSAVRVYDITDPTTPVVLTGFDIQASGNTFSAGFEADLQTAHVFYAIAEDRIKTPSAIEYVPPANLKDTSNGADMIIITDASLVSAINPLVRLHHAQGLRVKTITTRQIFDEFNFGVFDPDAIRDFLSYAYFNWKPPAPTYVLMVGDANIDYRDYYKTGKKNLAPVHLSITGELGLTPDDNWYVCVDGDDVLPDMMIGRIPGSKPADVSGMIDKIVSYAAADSYKPKNVLLASDNEVGFENINNGLSAYLPAGFTAKKVYLRAYGSNVNGATDAIIAGINGGALMVNYTGHGSLNNWAGEFMFDSTDVNSLSNGDRLPFVMAFDCINGYFSQPFQYSLGQAFVAATDKGAVAFFGAAGLGFPWEHSVFAENVFDSVFNKHDNIIGSVILAAKINGYARGVSEDAIRMFNLFGDPATRLRVEPFPVSGDIDGSGAVDLKDAIIAMRIISGLATDGMLRENSLSLDKKIGLEDAIFVMQVEAGIR